VTDHPVRFPAGAAFLLLLLVSGLALAAGPSTRGRSLSDVTLALEASPHAGTCDRCHSEHGGGALVPHPNALMGPDDNSLCDGCHTGPWTGGSYPGTWLYAGSAHGSDASVVWPGPNPPARADMPAAGKCVNCHDPHGWADAGGAIPHLAVAREEQLCQSCHDGSPARINVQTDLLKAFRHPVQDYSGRHVGADESQPSSFGFSPLNNRHSECVDCHNPHATRTDPAAITSMQDAPKSTLGASRVRVLNGPAGTSPSYFFAAGSDTVSGPPAEYQLCFKCHSSWTSQPSGQTDFGLVLNPNNPSFHPVEGQGRNLNIPAGAFAFGWGATSLTPCGSCHGSDAGAVRGPHGSNNRYLLRQPYTASSNSRSMASNEICFQCHSYDVYANPGAPDAVRAYSRFNKPGVDKGHAEHVGEEQRPCYACHTTHGSTTSPHLIVTGRNPGISTYTETPGGGTCAPTCHGAESYTVNYAR
jgi:predicted CXXCH cytochrome family protein